MFFDIGNIQNRIIQFLPVEMAGNSQNTVPVRCIGKPFTEAGDKIRRFLGAAENADDIHSFRNFNIAIGMHEIILTSLMKQKIKRTGISAIHGNDQNNLVILLHLAVKAENVIAAEFALLIKTFIAAVTAGVNFQLPEVADRICF